jgi:hypothetical protein
MIGFEYGGRDAGLATHGSAVAVVSVLDGASPVATRVRPRRRRTNGDMKRQFCPRPLNKNTFTATASLSSSSNTHNKPRCRLHRRAGPVRRRPRKSVAVAIFIPRADTLLDPNSSLDGWLGSIVTLHPTVRTSDGLRGGGSTRLYFEGLLSLSSTLSIEFQSIWQYRVPCMAVFFDCECHGIHLRSDTDMELTI